MAEPSERHTDWARGLLAQINFGWVEDGRESGYLACVSTIATALAAAERRGAEAQRDSDLRKIFLFAASEQSLGFEDTVRVLNEVGDIIRTAPLATPPPDPWQRTLSLDEALAIGTELKARAVIAAGVGFDPAADVRAAALNVLANLSADDPHHLTREQLIYKIACSTRLLNRVLGRRLVERGGRDG